MADMTFNTPAGQVVDRKLLILYLNTKAKALVTMGMPMSILKESNIFDRIISVKYDVPNDRLDMFDDYRKEVDRFYDEVLEKNA